MKVILLQDLPKIGKKYEIREVKDGFARNLLIPQGKAELATPAAMKSVGVRMKAIGQAKAIQGDLLKKNIEALRGVKIVLKRKVNDKGHLFAAIHEKEIAEELEKQAHVEIPVDSIEIETPIKEVGEHTPKAFGQEFIVDIIALK